MYHLPLTTAAVYEPQNMPTVRGRPIAVKTLREIGNRGDVWSRRNILGSGTARVWESMDVDEMVGTVHISEEDEYK